jgi:hypothetical protein
MMHESNKKVFIKSKKKLSSEICGFFVLDFCSHNDWSRGSQAKFTVATFINSYHIHIHE